MAHFIPFCLPFMDESGNTVSPSEQASSIIKKAKECLEGGSNGVAIIYSANYGQTQTIHATYESGGWDTGTNGANQATVMNAMETLLGGEASALRGKLQIAPITTMAYSGGYGTKTHEEVVRSDLEHIKSLLDKGWDVLGWQNQETIPKYAIGGGVAGNAYPEELHKLVQSTLAQYAKDYP